MKPITVQGFAKVMRYIWTELVAALIASKWVPFPLRSLVLSIVGVRIGKNVIVQDISIINAYAHGFSVLRIGDNSYLGQEVMLDLANDISIGDNVTFAPRVSVYTHRNIGYPDHPLIEEYPRIDAGVNISSNTFIGAGATILPGAEVGEDVFVHVNVVVSGTINSGTELRKRCKSKNITTEETK